MEISESVLDTVGNTPLVHLKRIEEEFGLKATILAKLERDNPTGSIKDRAAKQMLLDAISEKRIKPGDTLVEPTSGNTGISLAALCAPLGIRLVIFMPGNCSKERIAMMKGMGAEVFLTPASEGMTGAVNAANAYLKANPNSLLAGQFTNLSNPKAHYLTTGPEIYRQTEGKLDVFVAGFGTGGTVSGTGRFLKEKNPGIKVIGLEPAGSPFVTEHHGGTHKIQGLGAGFIPGTLDVKVLDETLTITDEEAYLGTRLLWKKEGLFCGITSGCNVMGAIKLAKEKENQNKIIVTVLPDDGERYLSVEELYD